MDKKEEMKKFIREQFGAQFHTERELDEFAQNLLESAEKQEALANVGRAKVWKKEEIELLGLEITPVDWHNFG
tara:strand:+ start:2158 stop:2376 length:219 start_codon:yes stop_codon:yes gene_type:complete